MSGITPGFRSFNKPHTLTEFDQVYGKKNGSAMFVVAHITQIGCINLAISYIGGMRDGRVKQEAYGVCVDNLENMGKWKSALKLIGKTNKSMQDKMVANILGKALLGLIALRELRTELDQPENASTKEIFRAHRLFDPCVESITGDITENSKNHFVKIYGLEEGPKMHAIQCHILLGNLNLVLAMVKQIDDEELKVEVIGLCVARMEDAGEWKSAIQLIACIDEDTQKKIVQRILGKVITGEIDGDELTTVLNLSENREAKRMFKQMDKNIMVWNEVSSEDELSDTEEPPGNPRAPTPPPEKSLGSVVKFN